MRRIVSRGFTPRQLDQMKGDVEAIAAEIVDDVIERGEGDFVTDVAATLPLRIIVDMMGIPRSQERFIFDRTNVILGLGDPEYVPDQTEAGIMAALLDRGPGPRHAGHRAGARRAMKDPQDDLTTALVTAEVDGESLTPAELASFFILLVVAGNETTRNAIAHGLHALTEHPEQMARWQADFDGLAVTAVEEIVRWATPVIHFRRTCTQDGARIGDQEFNAGDKVVLWYASANRDAAVFDDPYRFDVGRTPNDHLGFGGPGPHFCLGAHLARREITVMFRELFRRMPDIRAVGRARSACSRTSSTASSTCRRRGRPRPPPERAPLASHRCPPPVDLRRVRVSSSCSALAACSGDDGGGEPRRAARARSSGRPTRASTACRRSACTTPTRPHGVHRRLRAAPAGRRDPQPGVVELRLLRRARRPTSTWSTTSSTARCGSPTPPTSTDADVEVIHDLARANPKVLAAPYPDLADGRGGRGHGLGPPAPARRRRRPAPGRVRRRSTRTARRRPSRARRATARRSASRSPRSHDRGPPGSQQAPGRRTPRSDRRPGTRFQVHSSRSCGRARGGRRRPWRGRARR